MKLEMYFKLLIAMVNQLLNEYFQTNTGHYLEKAIGNFADTEVEIKPREYAKLTRRDFWVQNLEHFISQSTENIYMYIYYISVMKYAKFETFFKEQF